MPFQLIRQLTKSSYLPTRPTTSHSARVQKLWRRNIAWEITIPILRRILSALILVLAVKLAFRQLIIFLCHRWPAVQYLALLKIKEVFHFSFEIGRAHV